MCTCKHQRMASLPQTSDRRTTHTQHTQTITTQTQTNTTRMQIKTTHTQKTQHTHKQTQHTHKQTHTQTNTSQEERNMAVRVFGHTHFWVGMRRMSAGGGLSGMFRFTDATSNLYANGQYDHSPHPPHMHILWGGHGGGAGCISKVSFANQPYTEDLLPNELCKNRLLLQKALICSPTHCIVRIQGGVES